MTIVDFITQLFFWVDDNSKNSTKTKNILKPISIRLDMKGFRQKKKGEEREKVKEGKKARSENLAL